MAGLGTILNEIIDDADGELALKFTLTLGTGNVAASRMLPHVPAIHGARS